MISIIISAFDEEKAISHTLKEIINYLNNRKFNYEIICIDDGSKDKTYSLMMKFPVKAIRHRRRKGKGFSIKEGILQAKGDLIFFTDADLFAPIEELDKFLDKIKEGYDIVIASRYIKKGELKRKWVRNIASRIFNIIIESFFHLKIKDTQCGFKLLKADAAKRIFSKIRTNGFIFDVEMLLFARYFGYKVVEVPIKWLDFNESSIKPFGAAPKMIYEIIKLLIRYG